MDQFTFYKDKNGNEEFELGFMQNVMFYNSDMNCEIAGEKKGFANIGSAFRIRMKIDTDRMEKSLQRIFDENEMLRIIAVQKGKYSYMQKIVTNYKFHLDVFDAEGNTPEEKYNNAIAKATKIMQQYIDCYHNISAHPFLIRLAEDDYFFVVVTHHWVGDGASLGIIMGQIFKYYMNPHAETVPSGSYLDYLEEERTFKFSEKGQKELEFWKNEFDGYQKIDLSKATIGEPGSSEDLSFSIDISKASKIAAVKKTSVFQVILLAYHVGLDVVIGESDVAIGATSACRSNKYSNTVGFFAHSAFHRLQLTDSDNLYEQLGTSVQKHSKAMSNIHTTFDFYDNMQFCISYLPGSSSKKGGLDFEQIPIPSVREVASFYLGAFEYPDKILLDFIGSGRIFTTKFRYMLRDAIVSTLEVMYDNENATVADVKKYYAEKYGK